MTRPSAAVDTTGRLFTPAQVGELWGGISAKTVRRHIAAGGLPIVDIAAPGSKKPCTRIRECDAIEYVASLVRGRC